MFWSRGSTEVVGVTSNIWLNLRPLSSEKERPCPALIGPPSFIHFIVIETKNFGLVVACCILFTWQHDFFFFLGMTFWDWKISCCAHSCGRLFLCLGGHYSPVVLCRGLRSHEISPVHITMVLVLFCFWSWLGMDRLHFFVRRGTFHPLPLFHIGVMSDLSLCRSCACCHSPWEFICPCSPMFPCIAVSLALSDTSGYNSLSIRTSIQGQPLQISQSA